MPAVSLPHNPSLEYLRGQCRALQRAVRRGEPEALRRVADQRVDVPDGPGTFALSAAQLVVARECGFASWPRLRLLLVELGFPVNALGRGDTPGETPWETGLHRAAGAGDVELARTLLALGADPNITDARFGSTPLGWARHFDHPELIELLEPVTVADSP